MVKLLRMIMKLVLLAAMVLGVAAGARALVGWLSGEPGDPSTGTNKRQGSFDSWPPVPQAPGRDAGAGTGNGSGAGAGAGSSARD